MTSRGACGSTCARSPTTRHRFVLYELYTDAEAFAAHKASPHFARWRQIAEQVLAGQVNTPGELLVTHTAEESA